MANNNLTITIKIDGSIFEKLFKEYLLTLADDDGDEIYDSYRGHAESVFEDFQKWLKERND